MGKRSINTEKAPAAIGPYSQAIEINNMIYTSGMLPVDPKTGEMPEGAAAQAEQAFLNIKELLTACGTDTKQVIKTTVFIKNMNDFGTINGIYEKYFGDVFPARSCVEVARLPKDALLEIEVVAVKEQ